MWPWRDGKARKRLGRQAEWLAGRHLRQRGYRILCRNFHCKLGELDLVARDRDGTIVFVEVRARRTTRFGTPAESVDREKQDRLIKLAAWYIRRHRLEKALCRIDVVSVILPEDGRPAKIEHIRNAVQG